MAPGLKSICYLMAIGSICCVYHVIFENFFPIKSPRSLLSLCQYVLYMISHLYLGNLEFNSLCAKIHISVIHWSHDI